MPKNKTADTATAVGVGGCILALTNPVTAPIALLGIPLILGARLFRGMRDKQEPRQRKSENRERRGSSMFYPDLLNNGSPFGLSPTVLPANPLSVLSEEEPSLGFRAIMQQIEKKSYVETHSLSPEIRDIAVSMISKHPCPTRTTIRRGIRRSGFLWSNEEEITDINVI